MLLILTTLISPVILSVVGSLTFWRPTIWYEGVYRVAIMLIGGFVFMVFFWFIFCYLMSLFVKKKIYTEQSKWALFWLKQGHDAMLFFARVKTRIHGKKKLHIEQNKKFLLVCNHRSIFDSMVMTSKLNQYEIAFITKKANYKIPFFGRFLYGACFYAVDREDHIQSLQVFHQASDLILNGKANVGVFPEGTRQNDTIIGDFHEGVFNIALRAKCPIVVVTADGGEEVKHNFPWKRTYVDIDILGVINYDEIESETAKSISDRIKAIMTDHLEKIDILRHQRKFEKKANK